MPCVSKQVVPVIQAILTSWVGSRHLKMEIKHLDLCKRQMHSRGATGNEYTHVHERVPLFDQTMEDTQFLSIIPIVYDSTYSMSYGAESIVDIVVRNRHQR